MDAIPSLKLSTYLVPSAKLLGVLGETCNLEAFYGEINKQANVHKQTNERTNELSLNKGKNKNRFYVRMHVS